MTFSGSGTTVITYMATTVSKAASGNFRSAASISCRPVTLPERLGGDALARLLQHLGRQVDADDLEVAVIVGQRKAGANADLEHAPVALVDDLDRMLAPLARRRGQRCGRRPAPSGDRRRARRPRRCGRCRRCVPGPAPGAPAVAAARSASSISFGYSLLLPTRPKNCQSCRKAPPNPQESAARCVSLQRTGARAARAHAR